MAILGQQALGRGRGMKWLQTHARQIPGALFVLALVLAPNFVGAYAITLMNYIGLYTIVTVGLVLLTGVAGLTSFGQAAFVGIGAYTTGYLTTTYAISPWLGLLAGMVCTMVVAWVLGLLTLRLSGHYLPLGT